MNTDEHGYLDSLTERVMAAVFEVSNTLGRFPRKGLRASPATRTGPPRYPCDCPSFLRSHL